MISTTTTVCPIADGSPGGVRDARGRFVTGNPGGPGNPHGRRVQELRAAMLDSITADDLQRVARMLVDKALEGDIPAARELLDRVLGRPGPGVDDGDGEARSFKIVLLRDEGE